jgi:antitoxin (DNA-binding transcriptional repressor) of toxin-antitoxin stability system
MRSLEMKELIEHIDEMLRIVVEEGESIEITKQGEL